MNDDLIDNLAKKAGAGVCCYDDIDLETFAELILKEAISSIDEQISFSDADTAGDIAVQLGMYNAKDIIMKHFGVKKNEND